MHDRRLDISQMTHWHLASDEPVARTHPGAAGLGRPSVESVADVGLTSDELFGGSSFEQASRLLELTGAGLAVLGPDLEVLAASPCAKWMLGRALGNVATPVAAGGGAVESFRGAILRVQEAGAGEVSICVVMLGDTAQEVCEVRCIPLGSGVALVVREPP